MLESFETIDLIVVVTELAEIDLYKFLKVIKLKSTQLAAHHVQKLAWDLLSALHYLHSKRILHRDLKPQNILLNNFKDVQNMQAKLCDFGLARYMDSNTFLMTSIKGTPLYMAPEVLHDNLYDEKADFWSIGCIIYEALCGDSPVGLANPKIKIQQNLPKLMEWLRAPNIEWLPTIPKDCKSFLQGLLQRDPKARPSWSDIKQHPYIADHLLIVDDNRSDCPLTQTLTMSQQIKKEKQRNEIIFHRSRKMIDQAMNKCHLGDAASKKKDQKEKKHDVIGDNASISSADSINAIIQTDLDTDVEGPMERKLSKRVNPAMALEQNMVIQRFTPNKPTNGNAKPTDTEILAKDIGNLRIGTMATNIQQEEKRDASIERPQPPATTSSKGKIISSKELDQKKMCQNLENMSIRMRSHKDTNGSHSKEKTKESGESSQTSGNTGGTVIDSFVSEQDGNVQFENDEWLAYIFKSMQEVYDGHLSSLIDPNMV